MVRFFFFKPGVLQPSSGEPVNDHTGREGT